MNSALEVYGPALILKLDEVSNRVLTVKPVGDDQKSWNLVRLHKESITVIQEAMRRASSGSHPERIAYAFCSKVFCVMAPRPIGGKRKPGFLSFLGKTGADVVNWTMLQAVQAPIRRGKSRHPYSGFVLEFAVRCFNETLDLDTHADKDRMDDAVMRGMRRAGHFDLTAKTVLPPHLRRADHHGHVHRQHCGPTPHIKAEPHPQAAIETEGQDPNVLPGIQHVLRFTSRREDATQASASASAPLQTFPSPPSSLTERQDWSFSSGAHQCASSNSGQLQLALSQQQQPPQTINPSQLLGFAQQQMQQLQMQFSQEQLQGTLPIHQQQYQSLLQPAVLAAFTQQQQQPLATQQPNVHRLHNRSGRWAHQQNHPYAPNSSSPNGNCQLTSTTYGRSRRPAAPRPKSGSAVAQVPPHPALSLVQPQLAFPVGPAAPLVAPQGDVPYSVLPPPCHYIHPAFAAGVMGLQQAGGWVTPADVRGGLAPVAL